MSEEIHDTAKSAETQGSTAQGLQKLNTQLLLDQHLTLSRFDDANGSAYRSIINELLGRPMSTYDIERLDMDGETLDGRIETTIDLANCMFNTDEDFFYKDQMYVPTTVAEQAIITQADAAAVTYTARQFARAAPPTSIFGLGSGILMFDMPLHHRYPRILPLLKALQYRACVFGAHVITVRAWRPDAYIHRLATDPANAPAFDIPVIAAQSSQGLACMAIAQIAGRDDLSTNITIEVVAVGPAMPPEGTNFVDTKYSTNADQPNQVLQIPAAYTNGDNEMMRSWALNYSVLSEEEKYAFWILGAPVVRPVPSTGTGNASRSRIAWPEYNTIHALYAWAANPNITVDAAAITWTSLQRVVQTAFLFKTLLINRGLCAFGFSPGAGDLPGSETSSFINEYRATVSGETPSMITMPLPFEAFPIDVPIKFYTSRTVTVNSVGAGRAHYRVAIRERDIPMYYSRGNVGTDVYRSGSLQVFFGWSGAIQTTLFPEFTIQINGTTSVFYPQIAPDAAVTLYVGHEFNRESTFALERYRVLSRHSQARDVFVGVPVHRSFRL